MAIVNSSRTQINGAYIIACCLILKAIWYSVFGIGIFYSEFSFMFSL